MDTRINPNSGLDQSVVSVPSLVKVPEDLLSQAKEFQEAIMIYSCAIRAVKTKLEVLNDELSIRSQHNPIEMIKSRVKKPKSIVGKLKRRNLPITLESMMGNLNDIAGVRVICSFLDDIYAVAHMLVSQDDVTVIEIKDYIKNPKDNGYRSYHLIIEVPVFLSDRKENVRVEVQIRTIAMDFWASLDHQLKYKKNIGDVAEEIGEELRQCADMIAGTDQWMQEIRKSIEAREHS